MKCLNPINYSFISLITTPWQLDTQHENVYCLIYINNHLSLSFYYQFHQNINTGTLLQTNDTQRAVMWKLCDPAMIINANASSFACHSEIIKIKREMGLFVFKVNANSGYRIYGTEKLCYSLQIRIKPCINLWEMRAWLQILLIFTVKVVGSRKERMKVVVIIVSVNSHFNSFNLSSYNQRTCSLRRFY